MLPAQESHPAAIRTYVACHTCPGPRTLRYMGLELATGDSVGVDRPYLPLVLLAAKAAHSGLCPGEGPAWERGD